MKKLFRMKYEPCAGSCYAPGADFCKKLTELSTEDLETTIKNINYLHDKSCGDTNIRFVLDEDKGILIGSFITPEGSQSFISSNLLEMSITFRLLLDDYLINQKTSPDKQVCDHGRDDNIRDFTLSLIRQCKSNVFLDTYVLN